MVLSFSGTTANARRSDRSSTCWGRWSFFGRGYSPERKFAVQGATAADMIDCCGRTDVGRVRQRNEDQFLMADLNKLEVSSSAPNLLVVADGVGGYVGGERASRAAVDGVLQFLLNHRNRLSAQAICGDEIGEELESAVAWAQQIIRNESATSPELARMGTTLTLAYIHWPIVYVAHVGDSRAYIYRRQELFQITRDQSIAQMMADAGMIDEECVAGHRFRNILGSLICSDPRQLLTCIYTRRLIPGDQLLLCTDGLTKHVSAAQIAEILDFSHSAEEACRELIEAANAGGGTDNTTVVLTRFGRYGLQTDEDSTVRMEIPLAVKCLPAMGCSA